MAVLFKIFWEKVLTFFMAALDAQQNFMPTRYLFFFLSLFDQKVAKGEHTICDCN